MAKSSSSKIKIMIGSTVYGFPDQLAAICDVIESYGYEAINSHRGTMRVDPTLSNLENCLQAVHDCDAFLGIIRPYYGSGNINGVNITFEEMKLAMKLKKPYWFLVHRDVTFARQLFRNLVPKGDIENYELKKNHIFDMRTLEVYDYVIKNGEPLETRTGNWAQEFYKLDEALTYVRTQFQDIDSIKEMVTRSKNK
ncbi:hypothetical protein BCY89_26845 [Sphingobacterium siyangense]|uniref:DUF4062 domain-containing protein n=1 Tax=Sphingobacterium siyangense TaxID=459529 RepID=A0A420G0M9_9SPHI|nr:DUF4062 domain-containing protein [Sphingobacterium siyangense]RKF38684.1 hypothetical protein BCY89_26845 [Sphingobacterium siyangense]